MPGAGISAPASELRWPTFRVTQAGSSSWKTPVGLDGVGPGPLLSPTCAHTRLPARGRPWRCRGFLKRVARMWSPVCVGQGAGAGLGASPQVSPSSHRPPRACGPPAASPVLASSSPPPPACSPSPSITPRAQSPRVRMAVPPRCLAHSGWHTCFLALLTPSHKCSLRPASSRVCVPWHVVQPWPPHSRRGAGATSASNWGRGHPGGVWLRKRGHAAWGARGGSQPSPFLFISAQTSHACCVLATSGGHAGVLPAAGVAYSP